MALVLSVLAAGVAAVGSFFVARQYKRMGGGEAQVKLNELRKEIVDDYETRVDQLEDQFTGCRSRLAEVEAAMADMKTKHDTDTRRWTRERFDLKQEISDLHDEIRTLRPNRPNARDRAGD